VETQAQGSGGKSWAVRPGRLRTELQPSPDRQSKTKVGEFHFQDLLSCPHPWDLKWLPPRQVLLESQISEPEELSVVISSLKVKGEWLSWSRTFPNSSSFPWLQTAPWEKRGHLNSIMDPQATMHWPNIRERSLPRELLIYEDWTMEQHPTVPPGPLAGDSPWTWTMVVTDVCVSLWYTSPPQRTAILATVYDYLLSQFKCCFLR
jgi:hypothetical protein